MGVEEDRATGAPKRWDGVTDQGKLVEQIHQYAANVEPLPLYDVHVTDRRSDTAFVLVRIVEGDKTPYYVQNDANIWVRTGNISNPIDIASPDAQELLFGKREKARLARENYLGRAQSVWEAALRRADRERNVLIVRERTKRERDMTDLDVPSLYYQKPLGTECSLCTAFIQPFFPRHAFTTPSELKFRLKEIAVQRTHWQRGFPALDSEPVPDGVMKFEWAHHSGRIYCEQLNAGGLVCRTLNVRRVSREHGTYIYIAHVASILFSTLKVAGNLYRLFGYQGSLIGKLALADVEGVTARPIVPTGRMYLGDPRRCLKPEYEWDLELDTSALNNDKNFQSFWTEKVKEVYWSLGYEAVSDDLLKAFLKQEGWLAE